MSLTQFSTENPGLLTSATGSMFPTLISNLKINLGLTDLKGLLSPRVNPWSILGQPLVIDPNPLIIPLFEQNERVKKPEVLLVRLSIFSLSQKMLLADLA